MLLTYNGVLRLEKIDGTAIYAAKPKKFGYPYPRLARRQYRPQQPSPGSCRMRATRRAIGPRRSSPH